MSFQMFQVYCMTFKSKGHSMMGEFVLHQFITIQNLEPEASVFLVTVHDPICTESGNIEAALYGSFLPIPPMSLFPLIEISEYAAEKMPGAIIVKKDSPIIINEGRARIRLRVTNDGCRPVQVSNVPTPQNQF
jgi:urease